jgi:hypothetical protein
VAAAERGRRAWLWRRRPWGYLVVIGAALVMLVLESTGIAADQWYGHAADPAFGSVRGVHAGLRGTRADRADARLPPVPQPSGQGTRRREPPITPRWLITAPPPATRGSAESAGHGAEPG